MTAIYKYQVKKYELVLAGGKSRPAGNGGPIALGLYDDAGQIAQLFFHESSDTMPEQDSTPAEGDELNRFVKSHYLMSDYQNVLELLNSGRPVYCGHTRSRPAVWLTNDPRNLSEPQRH